MCDGDNGIRRIVNTMNVYITMKTKFVRKNEKEKNENRTITMMIIINCNIVLSTK